MTYHFITEKNIGGIIALFFGFLSLNEARKLYIYRHGLLTGDHALPAVIGFLLVLFGISLILERTTENKQEGLPAGKTRFTLIFSIFTLLIYCILIPFLGYIISTFAVSVLLIRIIGNYRMLSCFVFGAVTTSVLYFLFIVLLKTPFPGGILLL